MVSLGYKPSVMRHFRQCWNALKNHALRRGETHLTFELGVSLLREHYGIDLYAQNLKSFRLEMRRAVMLLLEFQVSGTIAKRLPKREHKVPDSYIDIVNDYLTFLHSNRHLRSGTIQNHRVLTIVRFFAQKRVTYGKFG
jgi:hypothetical protein